jgi:hypothetical protein
VQAKALLDAFHRGIDKNRVLQRRCIAGIGVKRDFEDHTFRLSALGSQH